MRATSRVRAALGIAPLAIISAAATVQVGQAGTIATTTVASPARAPESPASSPFVRQPLAPASVVGAPLSASAASRTVAAAGPVTAVSAADIPYAALAAYQRAATVVGAADPTCHLDWALLAGIGQVASRHGSLPEPRGGTAADTDAGQYDGDASRDNAVGPMRLLPATWSAIGVDGDGDGQRDPRDVDDAALAAAVYLCAGSADLAVPAAQRAAVSTYDATPGFTEAVLAAAAAYRVTPPVTTVAPTTVLARNAAFTPAPAPATTATEQAANPKPGKKRQRGDHAAAAPLAPVPPVSPAVTKPAGGAPAVTPPPAPEPTPDPTPVAATEAELRQACDDRLAEDFARNEAFDDAVEVCLEELTGSPLPAADEWDAVVTEVVEKVPGLVPLEAEPSPGAPSDTAVPGEPEESKPADGGSAEESTGPDESAGASASAPAH